MKLASTRKMAGILNANIDGITFEYVTATPEAYRRNINMDIYEAESYGDYNINTGKFRAIKVVYPCEYYAMPDYITTRDLHRLYAKGDTITEIIDKVQNAYAI